MDTVFYKASRQLAGIPHMRHSQVFGHRRRRAASEWYQGKAREHSKTKAEYDDYMELFYENSWRVLFNYLKCYRSQCES